MSPGDEVKMSKADTESSAALHGLAQLQELMATEEQPLLKRHCMTVTVVYALCDIDAIGL